MAKRRNAWRWKSCRLGGTPKVRVRKLRESPEMKFDIKLRQGLSFHQDRLFNQGDLPASETDKALLLTCGLYEFMVGCLEEEERFAEDWRRRG